jgi:trans-2-enoyl-CoA reductase
MLKDYGNLKNGDIVIQNSSNSAVGQSVIQLSKAWGFKTVNVIRNKPGYELIKESLYSLGADLVITEDEIRLPSTLVKITGLGGKVKLGLNGVGGKSATNIARLLA